MPRSNAAFSSDANAEATIMAASMEGAHCSEAYSYATKENIQIYGGVGFTWEYSAEFCFKRAKPSEVQVATSVQHRKRVAVALAIAPARETPLVRLDGRPRLRRVWTGTGRVECGSEAA
jgi:alkylation response protein AidB-like acyl-CoA dehydrogenase